MNKIVNFFKRSYVYLILIAVYVPLITGAIFSFNITIKGQYNSVWAGFTWNNWKTLFDERRDVAFVNTLLIAILVSFLVVVLSILSAYALYKQKNKVIKSFVNSSSKIPLVNPDNITALGLVLVFGLFFGIIGVEKEGFIRVIVAHTVMILPYGLSLAIPRSEKFNNNLYEAAQDLGYNKFFAWLKTYFIYMIPSIIMIVIVSTVLSFDDYIITHVVSNTPTLGTKMYEGEFKPWGLVLGTVILFIVIFGNIIYTFFKAKKEK
ncbi:ABC transporter permease subunit [Mycoplasmopsis citelli]|uniref:Spermidine/putrescine ABC transporter membrane protein n=1 Tax=Mycoplasmopsis citelli TaxID=171281 RepID=A0A449B1D2_9BACT|nr:ABC transporter permease subunit [Mycoplasmopsis citelli]UUD35878.1 ABC transporter permease subunit [Mycoplasmopsis citelli]VEU74410.1 spermidine/putrescine ABC transporter membrane protein [Mycoplasmopsis citelli]